MPLFISAAQRSAELWLAACRVETSKVVWHGAVDAKKVLEKAETITGRDAEDFLRELLANGPMPAKEAQIQCKEAVYSQGVIDRGRKRLGIKPRKTSMKGNWFWSLPNGVFLSEEREDLEENRNTPWGSKGNL